MSRFLKSVMWGTAILMALAGFGATWLNTQFHLPRDTHSRPQIVEFPKGTSLREIASRLETEGLIRSRYVFTLLSWLKDRSRELKAGEYRLSPAMSPKAILEVVVRGEVVQHALTIPEGYSVREIATAIARAGFGSARQVEAVASDPAFLKRFHIPAHSAEGYLFPETYHFTKRTVPTKLLSRMVLTFRERFKPEMTALAKKRNLSVHQVVTLASIIERETAVPAERPLIAAVFLNRMKRRMRLQADPTVLYALNRTTGSLTRQELRVDSPYNTYRIRGLPPGPIASPGLESLDAVLHPAPVGYLYFVARGDGSHIFSRTLKEHLKAVSQYRKSQAGNESHTRPTD